MPKYNSRMSDPDFAPELNFSSTTSRDERTLYCRFNSSSGFKQAKYFGEFYKKERLIQSISKEKQQQKTLFEIMFN